MEDIVYVITNGDLFIADGDCLETTQKIQNSYMWKDPDLATHVKNKSVKTGRLTKDYFVKELSSYSVYPSTEVAFDICTIRQFTEMCQNAKESASRLNDELKVLDRKLSDIIHYIEMNNVSASCGYKITKLIQNLRKKRRDVKDRLFMCTVINQIPRASVNAIIDMLSIFDNRHYIPREVDFYDIFSCDE